MKRKDILFAIIAFIAPFVVYILTAAPDVSFTDTGELAAVCVTLGVAHPTGYPLFTILGYIWSLLPLPMSEIYSLNIFSSFLTAMAGPVFFYIMRLIIKFGKSEFDETTTNILAISASLAFSFALTIWEQALIIEVYSLQILLVNLIILVTLKASFSKNPLNRYYILAGFLLALGFANHMTTIFLVPAMLFIYFKRPGESFDFSKPRLKLLLFIGLAFLAGLTFYLYLPIRSATFPEFNWGWVHRSFDKFLYHVTGKQYQGWMFSDSGIFVENLGKFFSLLPGQITYLGFIPLVIGFWGAFKKNKELAWFIIIFTVTGIIYSSNYSIHDIALYFSMPYIGFLLIMGIGFIKIYQMNKKFLSTFILIAVISIFLNYSENDYSRDRLVPEYVKLVANNLEEDALVVSAQADFWINGLMYKQAVEGYRTDIVVLEKELLRRTWYPLDFMRKHQVISQDCRKAIDEYLADLEDFESGEEFGQRRSAIIQRKFENMINCIIDNNIDKRPVYITLDVLQSEQNVGRGYKKVAEGMAIRLVRQNETIVPSLENVDISALKKNFKGRNDYLAEALRSLVAVNLSNIGRYCLAYKYYDTSMQAFRMALEIEPGNRMALQGLEQLNQIRQQN